MAHPRVLEWYGASVKPASHADDHDYFDDFDEMDSDFAIQFYHNLH
jgi:hypothetical protein